MILSIITLGNKYMPTIVTKMSRVSVWWFEKCEYLFLCDHQNWRKHHPGFTLNNWCNSLLLYETVGKM